jgi:HD-GYP domain-containing protein (c-di-GMP phosphodiesterase class II)
MDTNYISIPRGAVRPDTSLPFNLFQLAATPAGEKYILLIAKNLPYLESHAERLIEDNVDTLYVDKFEVDLLKKYMRDNLADIISDSSITREDKARVLVDTAQLTVIDVFSHPEQPAPIREAAGVVGSITRHLLGGHETFIKLFNSDLNGYYLYSHSVKVCVYTVALARRIGVTETRRLLEIGIGSFLHDVGMREVPDEKFMKEGFLTPEEWNFIRRHPGAGVNILSDAKLNSETALALVRQHHEKSDGSGYPAGIKDAEIHPYAKMLTIADIFDALTSKRPYRKMPATTFTALKEMRFEMKPAIDQKMLEEFIYLFAKK